MATKKQYFDQIKSPKWQKRRLEILSRDGFKCTSCSETNDQLHIHHLKYDFTKNIWDYEDEDLITLCEICHQEIEDSIKTTYSVIRKNVKSNIQSSHLKNFMEKILSQDDSGAVMFFIEKNFDKIKKMESEYWQSSTPDFEK